MNALTPELLQRLRAIAEAGTPLARNTVLQLIERAADANREEARAEAAELWTVAHPCNVTHEQPYDFKSCETHDRTFPLDGDCDHKGKSALEWQDAREQEQRMRAITEANRAEAAEGTMAAAQEAWDEYKAKLGGGIPDYYKNRIDGALTGHWLTLGGTPTGELADVCSCGKSYWPCDSLDGGA